MGLLKKLEELLGNYADSGGILKQRQNSLNGQLEDLKDDVSNHEYRMESLEESLRKKICRFRCIDCTNATDPVIFGGHS